MKNVIAEFKNAIPEIKITQFFSYLLSLGVLFAILGSCSQEPLESETVSKVQKEELFSKKPSASSSQEQLVFLKKKMRKFHNFQVAQAQGYTVLVGPPPNMYVPNMGYHYLNPDKVNGEFNLLEPEILVYHEDETGNMVFGAAEYLVPIPGLEAPFNCDIEITVPIPDSFIGEADQWEVNCGAGGYTLHAWVGIENPMGVFHPTNPLVPASPN